MKWNTDLYASLNQLVIRPINHTEVDERLPRKHLLIFNGLMSTPVDQLMDDLNKHYQNAGVPLIEVWDINNVFRAFG
jgi:hypothetical protein